MKNLLRISGFILFVILIYSCIEKPTPPVLTTTAVTGISYTTATSGGDVTEERGAPVLYVGICWNTAVEPTLSNNKTIESGELGPFTSNMTQLTPNTLYYVRAYATNSAGTAYGNEVSFTTSQVAVPVLTTAEVTSIDQTTAVSGGNITDDKGGSVTVKGVCWAKAANPTTSDSKTTDGPGTGSYVSNLADLTQGTVYYVRAYATNSAGTSYGNEISFTTTGTSVQYSNATLNGPWFIHSEPLTPYDDNLLYVVFDGEGNIIDMSGFGDPGGTYAVTSGGAFSGSITMGSDNYPFSGQLSSLEDGTITLVDMDWTFSKIANPGALTNSLVGTLITENCGQQTVTINLDSQGQITSATGLTGPVTGRVYTDSGVFAGHIKTGGENGWNEFSIWGYYDNNSLNGQIGLDWNSCGAGTVTLVRN